jgi:hypothetical protein
LIRTPIAALTELACDPVPVRPLIVLGQAGPAFDKIATLHDCEALARKRYDPHPGRRLSVSPRSACVRALAGPGDRMPCGAPCAGRSARFCREGLNGVTGFRIFCDLALPTTSTRRSSRSPTVSTIARRTPLRSLPSRSCWPNHIGDEQVVRRGDRGGSPGAQDYPEAPRLGGHDPAGKVFRWTALDSLRKIIDVKPAPTIPGALTS